MDGIGPRSLVIVHCTNPREKLWGILLRLDGVGAVLRGLDLASVEDWLRQERSGSAGLIAPSTCFIPAHRIHRIDLDESSPAVDGYGARYAAGCGRDVREALLGPGEVEE